MNFLHDHVFQIRKSHILREKHDRYLTRYLHTYTEYSITTHNSTTRRSLREENDVSSMSQKIYACNNVDKRHVCARHPVDARLAFLSGTQRAWPRGREPRRKETCPTHASPPNLYKYRTLESALTRVYTRESETNACESENERGTVCTD